jgi:EF-hand domain pair
MRLRTRVIVAAVLALLLIPATRAADGVPSRKKPDPPFCETIMTSLRAWFNNSDADKNGALDKEELAKAFKNAKPVPAKPGSTGDKKEKPKPVDEQFLEKLDKNNDGHVSREEYEDWAREFAPEARKALQAQKRVTEAELLVNRSTSVALLQRRQIELKNARDQLKIAFDALSPFDQLMYLNLKPVDR